MKRLRNFNMADELTQVEKLRCYVLLIVDHVIAALVVGPLVASCWRGTWLLCDLYILPDDLEKSLWVSFCVGNGTIIALGFLQTGLTRLNEKWRHRRAWWLLGNHLYSYVMLIACVNSWRGTWLACDYYTGTGVKSDAATFVAGLGLLYLLRSSNTVMCPPVIVAMDTEPDHFAYPTRFQTEPADLEHYILDVLLTTMLIHGLVILTWRGSWSLLDQLLYPTNLRTSALASLAAAALVLAACTAAEIAVLHNRKSLQDRKYTCILVETCLFTFANLATVCHWRGVWAVSDLYILPGDDLARAWLLHGVGTAVLMLGFCSNSLGVKFQEVDGSALEGEASTIYPNRYIRYFLDKYKSRREIEKKPSPQEESNVSLRNGHPVAPNNNHSTITYL